MIVLTKPHKHHVGSAALIPAAIPAHGVDSALVQGLSHVRDYHIRGDVAHGAEARAGRTCAKGRVEGKHARRQLFYVDAAFRAGIVLGKQCTLTIRHDFDSHKPARFPECCFNGIVQALGHTFPDDYAVNHQIDVVLFLLVQFRCVIQVVHIPVNQHPHKSRFRGILKQLFVLAFSGAHHWGKNHQPRIIRHGLNGCHHLIHRLLTDFLAALRAMGNADAGIKQPEVVMYFGHCSHSGAGIVAG